MLTVTIQTRKFLNEAKERLDAHVSYEQGRENPFNKYDRLVPKDATYYAFVLDDGENLDVAEDVFLGLEHREGRSMRKQTFESYRDIGFDFNPRFVGKKVVLYSI